MVNKITVLIVEDQFLIMLQLLDLVRQVFGSAQILTAGNGKEGLRQAIQNKLDLIITDLDMPVMDGYEMVKRIRREKNNRRVRVIGLSGSHPGDDKTVAFSRVCDEFLSKPFIPHELLDMIYRLVG